MVHGTNVDRTGEFTVSIPLGKPDAAINRICGWQSGFNIDKVKEAGLTLENRKATIRPAFGNIRSQ